MQLNVLLREWVTNSRRYQTFWGYTITQVHEQLRASWDHKDSHMWKFKIMPLFKTHRHMCRYESNANFSLANASLLQIHVSGVNTWDEHWKYRDTHHCRVCSLGWKTDIPRTGKRRVAGMRAWGRGSVGPGRVIASSQAGGGSSVGEQQTLCYPSHEAQAGCVKGKSLF